MTAGGLILMIYCGIIAMVQFCAKIIPCPSGTPVKIKIGIFFCHISRASEATFRNEKINERFKAG